MRLNETKALNFADVGKHVNENTQCLLVGRWCEVTHARFHFNDVIGWSLGPFDVGRERSLANLPYYNGFGKRLILRCPSLIVNLHTFCTSVPWTHERSLANFHPNGYL